MKAFEMTFFLHIALSMFVAVSGHGRLLNPLGRSSAWRAGYNTPKNYNDNELYCGGFAHQQSLDGKCGLCGDPYDQAHPRENEAGGKYATGLIVSHYNMGSAINITVQLTANHLGYFEFRLCVNNNVSKAITEECLSQHMLTNSQTNDTKHHVDGSRGAHNFTVTVTLPMDVTCSQCVMQWKYRTGNSWGVDETGSGLGHGPQEEFYACSDIAITNGAMSNTTSSASQIPTTSFTTASERSTTLLAILKSSTTSKTTLSSTTTTKSPSTTPRPPTTTTPSSTTTTKSPSTTPTPPTTTTTPSTTTKSPSTTPTPPTTTTTPSTTTKSPSTTPTPSTTTTPSSTTTTKSPSTTPRPHTTTTPSSTTTTKSPSTTPTPPTTSTPPSTTTKSPSTTPTPFTTTIPLSTTTTKSTTMMLSTTTTATPTSTASSSQTCVSVSAVATDSWCSSSCNHEPPYCPSNFCQCT
ncbi:uncharacterized protein [Argopecten irradians]|uniref:uncharacterized protein n=1 Tax=Argopecten irradians TaxID=31199 RepID=UPI0037168660